ncbi:hypothetical protein [Bacillus suaedaesalsae]|uniref:DUF3221 domain-containing protein n=1 Tax=Bacillus suaedaesalsae TaxID=2810349 RepID=A0ABS2DI92_9BACI|nr:hypothetical protein [Bacillus suaedaesalsae]MBM6617730.1 hypothetical protein [Bacillus suaedaesalsae]
MKIYFTSILFLFFLVGCISTHQSEHPSPEEMLKIDGADIFLLGGYVYSNAEDVNWVTELDYTLGKQIGEISKQSSKASGFKNGTANKLPVGTMIYETNTPAFIVIVNGIEIPYIKMVEG